MKKIILIGSGNVATQLGLSLKENGFSIIQVWSKNIKNAKILANKINCEFTDSINKLKKADLFIVSIKDDEIENIVSKLNDIKIVHTSGTTSIRVFQKKFTHCGVFYPLQTFDKNIKIDFKKIPICIEASSKSFEKDILKLGNQISNNVILMDSITRKKLHIAAVFACNFSNHMYTLADKILAESKIKFDILIPLIEETVRKIKVHKPEKIQTGPAIRKDKDVLNNHIKMIKDKNRKLIYKLISESIIKTNG